MHIANYREKAKMLEVKSETYPFLEGGGQMGKLTRDFDWSRTPLGPVDMWPQSLRTAVDVVLHSEVPMLLWWGNDFIQFYNDAYRPSLGDNGKHPMALGQKGDECWSEMWSVIQPLVNIVRQGGATWSQDQLIPIFRNGQMEDVYWTFGYSPVRDDSGAIAGVLVICHETTRKVNALGRLKQSEKTLRSVIDHAPVGICIVDGDPFVVEVVNDVYLRLVEKAREDLQGKPLWEALPEARDQYAEILENVARTGIRYEGTEQQLKLVRQGKEATVYVDFVYEPMNAGTGSPGRRIMVLAIDVTDKVVARKKIEESEQRYRMLITESTVGTALYTGPDIRIQYVNDIMTGYWGKDSSVIGKTLAEAVPELEGQPFLEMLQDVFRSGRTYTGSEEEAVLHADGKLQSFYFNYIYKALRDSEGEIYGIHHMAMDVTEQVLARKKVEQSEANLRNIILQAPVAMCILKGPRFIIEIANEKMFALWGKESGTLLHRPIFEAFPEVQHQGFEAILDKVYQTGETFSANAIPTNLPRSQGIKTVYVNFVYEPFRNAEGVVAGIMAVATDVTEQVRARHRVEELVEERTRELSESNKSLKRSNDELAQFAYIASHDLQEPARKINTFVEMLKTNLDSIGPTPSILLEKIEQASSRMLSLIRDILTYSQLGKEHQEVQVIDLDVLLNSVMDDYELRVEEKDAVITADRLPQIRGIPVQINQLFANLISNALKFTHPDRKPCIQITCRQMTREEMKGYADLKEEGRYFYISFRDNGIGFNQKNARQIFDIFQRLHAKSDYEGTGIGLAMCKKIAQNHHGDIYAESNEGEGSIFHVILPAII
jgi:PAS domain S-box-containing protein